MTADADNISGKTVTQMALSQERIGLLVVSIFSVTLCCVVSQCLAASAKKSRLELNHWINKKKYEKDKVVQQIGKLHQMQMRRNNKNAYESSQLVSNGYFKDDVRESVDEESRFLNLGASDMPKDITALEYQNERSLYSKDRASLEKYGDIMIHGSPPHSRNLSKDASRALKRDGSRTGRDHSRHSRNVTILLGRETPDPKLPDMSMDGHRLIQGIHS